MPRDKANNAGKQKKYLIMREKKREKERKREKKREKERKRKSIMRASRKIDEESKNADNLRESILRALLDKILREIVNIAERNM